MDACRFARCTLLALAASSAMAYGEDPDAWKAKLAELGLASGAAVESIPHFRIDGFNALDEQHVVLYTGANRRFLVTLDSPCRGLTWAKRLAYKTSGGSLTRFDPISFRDGSFVQQCRIETLHALQAKQP